MLPNSGANLIEPLYTQFSPVIADDNHQFWCKPHRTIVYPISLVQTSKVSKQLSIHFLVSTKVFHHLRLNHLAFKCSLIPEKPDRP